MTDRKTASTINDAQLAADRADHIARLTADRNQLRTRLAEQEAETMRQHERADRAETALRELLATLYPITRLSDPTPLGWQTTHPIPPDDYQRWTTVLNQHQEQPHA